MQELTAPLTCPSCQAAGSLVFEPSVAQARAVRCTRCEAKVSVTDGVPDLAPHLPVADTQGVAQRAMNGWAFAAMYESSFWRPFLAKLGSGRPADQEVEDVLALARRPGVNTIVDLASGTGHYARALCAAFPGADVYAVDVSPSMLKRCRAIAAEQQLSQLLTLRGDAYRLPFADGSVDVLCCAGALHLFTDLSPLWREAYRILRPGGGLVAFTIAMAPGPLKHVQNKMIESGRATFFDPLQLSADLAAFGFEDVRHQVHRVSLIFGATRR